MSKFFVSFPEGTEIFGGKEIAYWELLCDTFRENCAKAFIPERFCAETIFLGRKRIIKRGKVRPATGYDFGEIMAFSLYEVLFRAGVPRTMYEIACAFNVTPDKLYKLLDHYSNCGVYDYKPSQIAERICRKMGFDSYSHIKSIGDWADREYARGGCAPQTALATCIVLYERKHKLGHNDKPSIVGAQLGVNPSSICRLKARIEKRARGM